MNRRAGVEMKIRVTITRAESKIMPLALASIVEKINWPNWWTRSNSNFPTPVSPSIIPRGGLLIEMKILNVGYNIIKLVGIKMIGLEKDGGILFVRQVQKSPWEYLGIHRTLMETIEMKKIESKLKKLKFRVTYKILDFSTQTQTTLTQIEEWVTHNLKFDPIEIDPAPIECPRLPPELLDKILRHLNSKNLCDLVGVNHEWKRLIRVIIHQRLDLWVNLRSHFDPVEFCPLKPIVDKSRRWCQWWRKCSSPDRGPGQKGDGGDKMDWPSRNFTLPMEKLPTPHIQTFFRFHGWAIVRLELTGGFMVGQTDLDTQSILTALVNFIFGELCVALKHLILEGHIQEVTPLPPGNEEKFPGVILNLRSILYENVERRIPPYLEFIMSRAPECILHLTFWVGSDFPTIFKTMRVASIERISFQLFGTKCRYLIQQSCDDHIHLETVEQFVRLKLKLKIHYLEVDISGLFQNENGQGMEMESRGALALSQLFESCSKSVQFIQLSHPMGLFSQLIFPPMTRVVKLYLSAPNFKGQRVSEKGEEMSSFFIPSGFLNTTIFPNLKEILVMFDSELTHCEWSKFWDTKDQSEVMRGVETLRHFYGPPLDNEYVQYLSTKFPRITSLQIEESHPDYNFDQYAPHIWSNWPSIQKLHVPFISWPPATLESMAMMDRIITGIEEREYLKMENDNMGGVELEKIVTAPSILNMSRLESLHFFFELPVIHNWIKSGIPFMSSRVNQWGLDLLSPTFKIKVMLNSHHKEIPWSMTSEEFEARAVDTLFAPILPHVQIIFRHDPYE